MRCDVVAVGTELLLGQIVDTNSSWMGEQLAMAGIDSCLQVKVGDNRARMLKAITSTLADADAIIICGGLGPTHDDITREAIAEVIAKGGQALVMLPEIALTSQWIARFKARFGFAPTEWHSDLKTLLHSRGITRLDGSTTDAFVPKDAGAETSATFRYQ